MEGAYVIELLAKGLFIAFMPQLLLCVFGAYPTAYGGPVQQFDFGGASQFLGGIPFVIGKGAVRDCVDSDKIDRKYSCENKHV